MTQVVCYLKKCIHNEDNVCTKDVIMLDDEHFCNGGCDDGWEFAQKEDNDYIRRQDAIEVINQDRLTKLIDADVAESGLKNIPAADVVQVVRCGKCRYCTNNWHSSVYDLCKITGRNVIDTDFCNYGERREDY